MIVPPQPLDVLAWVTVRLHANGTLSTSGTVGDRKMALHLLDQAKDAIRRNVSERAIVIPGSEVDEAPSLPTRELGSMEAGERGDP